MVYKITNEIVVITIKDRL